MNRFATSALIAAGFVAATSANAVLTTVADYTFDDGTDLGAAGFTVNGDAAISGNALQLDGTGDYLTIADPLGGATDNFVVEAVFTDNFVGTGFHFAAARNTGTTNNGHGLLIQGGEFRALQSGVGTNGVVSSQVSNTPVTFSFVRQNGENSLWVDGVLQAGPTAINFNGTPDTLTIGAHNFDAPNGLFNGSIDRVRLSTIGANDLLGSDAGNDNFIFVIPEPSSLALLGLGGLVIARRRRG